MKIFQYLVLGLLAGSLSGTIGIGGGIILVPALVLIFEFSQHQAQGTTLALMIPPIGIFAAYTYFKAGHVDIKAAAIICIGFVVGGLIGAKLAVNLPKDILQKVFGVVLLTIGIYMIFKK